MKILDFYVSGQMITWQNPTEIIADSEKYLYCRFNFNSEWSGKEKAYRFIYKDTAYFSLPQDVDGEELVMIPPPVIKSPEFYIACGGYSEDGVFLPTAGVKIKVSENGFGEKDAALPEWEEEAASFTAQVLAAVSEANEATEANKEIAESCKQMVTENNEQLAESKTMVEEATALVKKAVNQPLWDIDPDTGLWMRFDMTLDGYVYTQLPSQGEKGEAGERGEKGDKGDAGEKGLKGDKGDAGVAGYTPQRGVDYWTEEDKEEITNELGGVFQEKLTDTQLENIDAVPTLKQDVHSARISANAASSYAANALNRANEAYDEATKIDLSVYETKSEAHSYVSRELMYLHQEVTEDIDRKMDKSGYIGTMPGTPDVCMHNNVEYRHAGWFFENDTPTLIINLPDVIDYQYMSWMSLPACDVTPSVAVVGDISWSGVDCDETGAFTPVAGVNYRLCVRNIGWNGAEPKIIGNVARW